MRHGCPEWQVPNLAGVDELITDSPTVAILTVATNRYLQYWRSMATSADHFLFPDSRLTFYVFTDQPKAALRLNSELTRSHVVPVPIRNLGWPEATLLRYEMFRDSWDRIQEDVVIHLDADMAIATDTHLDPPPANWTNGIAFVRHPGYRRPSLGHRLILYLKSPKHLKADFLSWRRHGALGSWETDRVSTAFVPRVQRRVYVCGGVWMGRREPLGQLISILADRTSEDLENGVIAVWHDESHLNWYASLHEHYLYDSEKCFAPGYANLSDLKPEIIAIEKGENKTR